MQPLKRISIRSAKGIVLLLLISSISGCLAPRMDRAEALISHPDFEKVVLTSPSFVERALNIIAELEHRIESQ